MYPYRSWSKIGFTLIEMIVAVALLALMVLLGAQLTASVMLSINSSGKRMTAESQARNVFGAMAVDFEEIVRRQDVDYYFNKMTGNDALFFYSGGPTYYNASVTPYPAQAGISLVGYRINVSNQLERLGKGLTWDASGTTPGSIKFLTFQTASQIPDASNTLPTLWPSTLASNSTDQDFHVIGDGVYRLEVNFLLTNGTFSNTPWISPPHQYYNGLSDVAAIVVDLGVLDNASRAILPTSGYTSMVAALPDSVEGTAISTTWGSSNYLATSGIPKTAGAQIRVFERYFYLNK